MRKVFLEELPKYKDGACVGKINWKEAIGYNVYFIYDDVKGKIEIIKYNKNTQKLIIGYNDKILSVNTSSFQKCILGKLVKDKSNNFKFKIDRTFNDGKRNITIINKVYKENDKDGKYYKYHCNKCGNEDWIKESALIRGTNCNVCSSSEAKLGFNTIWDTDRWMIDLGVSEEDAKKYTHSSSKKIVVKCPDCGNKKEINISSIYKRKTISCSCGDGKSYPEKFIFNLLEQLDIEFEIEYKPKWAGNKRYDFHLKNKNCIIETHGNQHYNSGFEFKGGRNLEEERQNDKFKKETALKNGVKNYIALDCRESNMDYIKNSILNSKLNELFDLSNINWTSCAKFANKNIVKEVCDYWNNRKDGETATDIGNKFKINRRTARIYLKRGTKLRWCDYDPSLEKSKRSTKKVKVFKNNRLLGIFSSCSELERQSEELFGVKLLVSGISMACCGKKENYKGFTFEYQEKQK